MEEKSVGTVVPKDFTFGLTEEDKLLLDCGRKIGPVNIRFETYGKLDETRSNAILILHALSGDAHVAGYLDEEKKKIGWWDSMVGPGKAFDTDKYFIVCSNVIGGCSGSTGPRSFNPDSTNVSKIYNMDFPVITIADMVRAQHRLMKHLGIEKWLSLSGGSMGGMQALEWVVSYPEAVASVIPIATTSCLSPQSISFNWVGRQAIMGDPNWNNGNYDLDKVPETGLAIARMLGHITYLSDKSMDKKFGRELQESESYSFDFKHNFKVESYLKHQGEKFVERFDANSYLYISRAMDYFDLSEKFGGNLSVAFSQVRAPFLIISFSSDWLFPPDESIKIVEALRINSIDVTYCDIKSIYGHDAFLLEVNVLERLISDFLRCRYEEVRKK
ncbi:MAG TPA: homoserine O-acetyltransferase [Lentisphaeria bacterium]|nr:MAG: homoserine O-acetyltransferase [Lentisphaerae bacterium GWF2_49_21]HBC87185.1 homoserine O-acetyltransferase [Lentisphaeria bacterium]